MNIEKEKISSIINIRFPRIANYLKLQTQSKSSDIIVSITYMLHKIYLNTLTTQSNVTYILKYLETNYITDYIKLSQTNKTLSTIIEIANFLSSKYITEHDLINLNEQELITLLNQYEDSSSLYKLKQNIINTYNAIKKQYKNIKIIK